MQILTAAIIAFLIASWVYNDARSRGINGLPWALLTFLVMIVGLPLYLFSRPKGQLVECSNCNKRKLDSLPICPHCSQYTRVAEGAEVYDKKKVCNNCGRIIESYWNFCPYCGSKQNQ